MLDWIRRRQSAASAAMTVNPTARTPREPRMDSAYASLNTYLEHRYANTVVLTFRQIEDLLGCALPARARKDQEWWTAHEHTSGAHYSNAWVLADMTATPNLLAQNVVFERAP